MERLALYQDITSKTGSSFSSPNKCVLFSDIQNLNNVTCSNINRVTGLNYVYDQYVLLNDLTFNSGGNGGGEVITRNTVSAWVISAEWVPAASGISTDSFNNTYGSTGSIYSYSSIPQSDNPGLKIKVTALFNYSLIGTGVPIESNLSYDVGFSFQLSNPYSSDTYYKPSVSVSYKTSDTITITRGGDGNTIIFPEKIIYFNDATWAQRSPDGRYSYLPTSYNSYPVGYNITLNGWDGLKGIHHNDIFQFNYAPCNSKITTGKLFNL